LDVEKVGSVPAGNFQQAFQDRVPLPPDCTKKILPVCPVLQFVGLAIVWAAVTVVKKFCPDPKLSETEATPSIAVVCIEAAADLDSYLTVKGRIT